MIRIALANTVCSIQLFALCTSYRVQMSSAVPFFTLFQVIHAVGPAYGYSPNEFSQSDVLLASAYVAAMRCASGVRSSTLAEANCF